MGKKFESRARSRDRINFFSYEPPKVIINQYIFNILYIENQELYSNGVKGRR